MFQVKISTHITHLFLERPTIYYITIYGRIEPDNVSFMVHVCLCLRDQAAIVNKFWGTIVHGCYVAADKGLLKQLLNSYLYIISIAIYRHRLTLQNTDVILSVYIPMLYILHFPFKPLQTFEMSTVDCCNIVRDINNKTLESV